MKHVLLVILTVLACVPLPAAVTNTIQGTITDRTDGSYLPGVTVRVDGTNLGAITNSKGRFVLKGVPDGTIMLRASLVGYRQEKVELVLKAGETRDVVLTMLISTVNANEVIVSASKRVQAAQDVPVSVSVVNSRDLSDRALTRLDDALRYVSGVTVARDQVSIRGSSGFAFGVGSRTMVLLDGAPLLSGDNGDIKFDVLPVTDVDRMEVIKGAGSALYGTGALGGVVNIITRQPSDTASVSLRAYSGVYTGPPQDRWDYRSSLAATSGADARYAQKHGSVSVSVSGGVRRDESYRSYDNSSRGYGYTSVGWAVNERLNIRAFGFGANELKENFIYWESLGLATQPQTTINRDERLYSSKYLGGLDIAYNLSAVTSITFRPLVMRTRFENRIADVVQDSNASTAYAYNAEAQLTSILSKTVVITGGLVGRLNDVSSTVYGQQLQSVLSGYAQTEWRFSPMSVLTAGLRADREKTVTRDHELQFSPKIGLSHVLSESMNLRASIGRGFRAPSIAERYATIRYGPFSVQPNSSVLSESSLSSEIGARYIAPAGSFPLELDFAVFDNELFNLIEPVFDTDSPQLPIVFKNVTRARILGAELTARSMLSSRIGVEVGITAMHPRDVANNEPLKYRSNLVLTGRGSWKPFNGLELQVEYRGQNRIQAIDDRLEIFVRDATARVAQHVVDGRAIVNLKTLVKIPLRASVIGRNLANYAYAEIPANLAPTRAVILQFETLF